jgi:hypothetical protein
MGRHTPRIILSARSSWKPVVEHDHANGEERQSHFKLANAARLKDISHYNEVEPAMNPVASF